MMPYWSKNTGLQLKTTKMLIIFSNAAKIVTNILWRKYLVVTLINNTVFLTWNVIREWACQGHVSVRSDLDTLWRHTTWYTRHKSMTQRYYASPPSVAKRRRTYNIPCLNVLSRRLETMETRSADFGVSFCFHLFLCVGWSFLFCWPLRVELLNGVRKML
jgi:hypothetical protein